MISMQYKTGQCTFSDHEYECYDSGRVNPYWHSVRFWGQMQNVQTYINTNEQHHSFTLKIGIDWSNK